MGAASIDFLLDGKKKVMSGIQDNRIVPIDLEYSFTAVKPIDKQMYNLAKVLTT